VLIIAGEGGDKNMSREWVRNNSLKREDNAGGRGKIDVEIASTLRDRRIAGGVSSLRDKKKTAN